MSLPAHVPVSVNFNVEIDADSKIQLFGEQAPTPTNVIVAEHTLPVDALYDADAVKGLIEIWEPANAQGDIKCQLANSDTSASGGPVLTGAYQTAAKRLTTGLEAILCDSFDCSGAAPYSDYTSYAEYYKQRDFGRVALGMMAHYLFGHVDATAAITNDKAFVESMLSIDGHGDNEEAGGAAARAAAYSKPISADVETWDFSSSSADANLAMRLVKAIIEKGKLGGDVTSTTLAQPAVSAITDTATDTTLANIVKQVIGQDSSRTQTVDGSERTREQHLLLRFYAGDVIYMNIKVKKPTVEVTGVATGANPPGNSLVTEQSYVLKITLAGSGTPPPPPPPATPVYATRLVSATQTNGTALSIPDQGPQAWFRYYGSHIRYIKSAEVTATPGNTFARLNYEVRDALTNTPAPAGVSVTLIMNKAYSNSFASITVNGTVANAVGGDGAEGARITATTDANGCITFIVYYNSGSQQCYSQICAGVSEDINDSLMDYIDIVELYYNAL